LIFLGENVARMSEATSGAKRYCKEVRAPRNKVSSVTDHAAIPSEYSS
jgi:hypothetical protein